MYKINNSYESEQSTSNSSSSNGSKGLTLGWDSLHNHQQLREYLYPTINEAEQTPSEQMKNDQHDNDSSLTSSKHSDFLGFSSLNNETPQNNKPTIIDHAVITIAEEIQNELTIKETAGSTAESLEKSNVSEEFSDQDVRFQIDMHKPDEIFNNTFENISQYTIEPASSDDDAHQTDESASDNTITNLPTLSVNENSSNAIDLTISSIKYVREPELIKDLSFNGKLNTESKIIETNETSGISFGNPLQLPEIPRIPDNETLNTSERSSLEMQLQLETSRELINERSPDLFSDDEEDLEDEAVEAKNIKYSTSVASTSISFEEKDNQADDYIEKNEKQISKRLQSLLSGILPPPTVTYVDHDITSLLTLYNKNVAMMDLDNKQNNIAADNQSKGWMPKKLDHIEWPHIERVNAHGLHYNRTKYTNNLEIMYMKLVERNVGQETGSSFTYNVSMSAKKKPIRKVIASPGNRLSHLARRRTVFSSATLQSQAQLSKLGRKPCVIDASKITKKEKVVTPKRRGQQIRRTPGRKTPGSLKKSAKKVALVIPKPAIATRETSRRALFLSPAQEEVKPNVAPEFSRRVEKSKRALFSPPRRLERSFSNISTISCTSSLGNSNTKLMHSENSLSQTSSFDVPTNLKRKRECDDGENMEPNCSKLAKYQGNLTSARLKSSSYLQSSLPKAASESSMYQNNQLSASHKQKLLWAVSTALKKKSITTSHQNFNHFASVLAKVVKRLYLETVSTKSESTSGTMLRLADRLAFYVIQGKTVDEIYLEEKNRIESAKMVNKRPSGYINRDEYLMRQDFTSKLNTSIQSNTTEPANENDIEHKPLTNSTSKSNVGVNALRENHDSKSAQKSTSNISFSGRNQKNLSPYNDKSRSASHLNNRQNKILMGTGSNNSLHSNIMKVKRQISFDN